MKKIAREKPNLKSKPLSKPKPRRETETNDEEPRVKPNSKTNLSQKRIRRALNRCQTIYKLHKVHSHQTNRENDRRSLGLCRSLGRIVYEMYRKKRTNREV